MICPTAAIRLSRSHDAIRAARVAETGAVNSSAVAIATM
jgi:hypothetical protein